MSNEMIPAGSTTESFNALTRSSSVEMAAAGLGAQAQAAVQARYIIAMRQPRNWDQVRQDVLHECSRPAFAHNKSALYRKPIGKGLEGLGIRFVEVALRCMRNVLIEADAIFEDSEREVIRVRMTDLEANITYNTDVRIDKTVWRSKPLEDGEYLQMKTNSQGRASYLVPASEDDYIPKRLSAISKATRTLGLRLIPGGIQDEAEETIRKIREDKAAKDPDAERRAIIDGFARLNVRATDLEALVGHSLDTCSPAELVDLRGYYGAIREGEATVAALLESIGERRESLKERMRTTPSAGANPTTAAAQSTPSVDIARGRAEEPAPDPLADGLARGRVEGAAETAPRKMTVHEGIEHLGKMGIGRGVAVTEIPALLAQVGVELPEGGAGLAITASMRDWRNRNVPWLHKTGEARGTKYWFGAPPDQVGPAADATPDPFALD